MYARARFRRLFNQVSRVRNRPPSPPNPTKERTSSFCVVETATVDSSTTPTTPENKATGGRWWHETRFNARGHLFTKPRRIGSDPSSSVRVETGTATGHDISRHHTPSNSVTSFASPELVMGGEGLNELSTKLVEAVEKQADLEDTLAVTRHELEVAQQKVKQLEQAQKEYVEMMEQGMLIEKKDVENETGELTRRLLEESKNRVQAENDKNKIEQELEMLTAKLFEEANNLVASARRENKALEKRNDQLQSRLEDTETLLQSQQDQLAELKNVMQRMQEVDVQTSPATPHLSGAASRESLGRLTLTELSPLHITNAHPDPEPAPDSAKGTEISPFSLFLRPRYRYDTAPYADFRSFVRISSNNFHARQSSGPYTLPGMESTPPGSRNSSLSSPYVQYSPSIERLPLKEFRFVKRSLTEDIDPALRLDIAPGLSWIARRSVLSAILDGTLIIEPTPSNSIITTYPCTLCGERRDEKELIRTHRFCTSDSPSSQRYPLCQYCLERMRVTCDYVGFLRAVRDGIWKVEGEEGEEKAWDETVRLRERMFWARLGTQGWNSTGPTTIPDDRKSTETAGSGVDPVSKAPVAGEPVTPELQITKAFEDVANGVTKKETQEEAESLGHEQNAEPVEGSQKGDVEKVASLDNMHTENEKETTEVQS